jgi:tetratricopeptide (TPR) repeat protein
MPPADDYKQVLQAFETGSPALAVELAECFLARDPAHPPVLFTLAQACMQLQRFPQARNAFERYEAAVGSLTAPLARFRGDLEVEAGAFATAEDWFRRALVLAPEDAGTHPRLGALLATQHRLEEAVSILRAGTICTAGPVDEVWLNLGLVLRTLGRFPEAREALDAALQLTPDYAEARRVRADVIQALARTAEA